MIRRIDTAALLVRSVPFGEADIVATLFTKDAGKVSAMVRGARRSRKRFGGALEPIHGLAVTFEDRGREMCTLVEARLARPRTQLVTNLEAMEAAGLALRWIRHLCPPRTPEPEAWHTLDALLDGLDEDQTMIRGRIAVFGLRLLANMGYGIDLDRCVRCGRPCPPGRSAFVDATTGGLICTSCGGARRTLSAKARSPSVDMDPAAANELVALVEDAMAAHAGFDPST